MMQSMVLEDGRVIHPIHYVLAGTVERVACTPGLLHLYSHMNKPVWMRTADPRVVTCPLCKLHPAWKTEMDKSAPLPRMIA